MSHGPSMESSPDLCDLRDRVEKIQWWHQIDLGHGIITPGGSRCPEILKTLHLPESLHGMTVLDVGAWDGFYSFEAERRGAKRVLATDSFCWGGEGWGTKAGFDLAKEVLGSRVESKAIDVLDLSPDKVGVFDVVLFLGVLYHMRHPLLALEKVASVTGKQLILETHVDMRLERHPVMRFYSEKELNNDATNWWGPSPLAVVKMLRAAGFRRVEIAHRLKPAFPDALKKLYQKICRGQKTPYWDMVQQGRIVVHAYK